MQSSNQSYYYALTDVTFRDARAAAEPDGTPGRKLYQSQAVGRTSHVAKTCSALDHCTLPCLPSSEACLLNCSCMGNTHWGRGSVIISDVSHIFRFPSSDEVNLCMFLLPEHYILAPPYPFGSSIHRTYVCLLSVWPAGRYTIISLLPFYSTLFVSPIHL